MGMAAAWLLHGHVVWAWLYTNSVFLTKFSAATLKPRSLINSRLYFFQTKKKI
jgi:hypothetical protein